MSSDKHSIVVDFDGTITMDDVSDHILKHFANGDWVALWKAADKGEISMNECIVRQFTMIEGEPKEIRSHAMEIPLREGFLDFLSFCRDHEVEVTCVSAGLSLVIDDFFEEYNIDIPYIAPDAVIKNNKVEVRPVVAPNSYIDFKHHQVRKLQEQGHSVIYIGDGGSDTFGMKYADHRITITGSSISDYCDREGLEHQNIDTFNQVIPIIDTIIQ